MSAHMCSNFQRKSTAVDIVHPEVVVLSATFGYLCFLLLDHVLVPISGPWFARAYRDRSDGGFVQIVDVAALILRSSSRAVAPDNVTEGRTPAFQRVC